MDHYDADLRSVQQARDLMTRAKVAQRAFQFETQERVDAICAAMVDAAMAHAGRLAQMAHDETGFGWPEHKRLKNEFAARKVWESIKDVPTCGVLRTDEEHGIVEIGWPVGVIAALTPCTNPTSTAIFKASIAVKARNALVIAPHPASVRCTVEATKVMADAGEAAGMPAGLVSCMSEVSQAGTQEMMRHHATSMILATGGPGMVRVAHSAGKPALGVGPGNVPVYVDRTADVEAAAACIVESKSFDCSTICATEQVVVADRPIAERLRAEMSRLGAHWLSAREAEVMAARLFRQDGAIRADTVGKTPQALGELAGVDVPAHARVLVADITGVGPEHPLSREKLTTVLGFIVEDGWRAGCERCIQLLRFGGDGHTLVIHSSDEESILAFGIEKPVFRIVVNTWGTLGAIGATTDLVPSLTLAPGGLGGAVVSDNISVHNLLHVKRLARGLRPPPPEARSPQGEACGAAPSVEASGPPSPPGRSALAGAGTDSEMVAEMVRRVLQELR